MIDDMTSRDHARSFAWNSKLAKRIDPAKPFKQELDLTDYVKKVDGGYGCTKCDRMLVRIEPDGIFGEKLNHMDASVILDHHIAKHDN